MVSVSVWLDSRNRADEMKLVTQNVNVMPDGCIKACTSTHQQDIWLLSRVCYFTDGGWTFAALHEHKAYA